MFYLYQHHDLALLADLMAALQGRREARSPLVPDTVLVPNRGTARWLQARLAASEGAAANLDLPLPGRFVWQVLATMLPGSPDSSAYERGQLVWHLYAVLPHMDLAPVRRYLATEPQERQRYQLAERLADVFDQYLIHRRQVLADWEAGREEAAPPASWQAPVWRALVQRLGPRHRARLLSELLEQAEDGALDVSALADPIYAFALAELPPDYLRLLQALGQYVDVHFLLPNPSAAYWGDATRTPVGDAALPGDEEPEPAHPLLASFGRSGRDLLQSLYSDELGAIHEPDLGEHLAYAPPGGDSLLQRVQSGIMAGAVEPADTGVAASDRSLQVQACHGPVREMQVLHDRLLDLMARDPALEAREILVMLPDVRRYAPAVHSVFGAAEGGRWIPYSVADRPRLDSHPIAQTFRQVMELPLSRWTATEVLALAEVPAVMRRFELDAADLEHLHQWVQAAGVRWGLDRGTRVAAGAAEFEQNTWRFGLDRLLLGLAQRADDELVDGVAPWSELEGGPAAAVGRLWWLLERLRHWRDRLAEGGDPATWQERLNAMIADLFAVDPDDPEEAAALATVHEAVATLEGAAGALGEEPLSWEAAREALLGALATGSQRQPLVTGGVTFAGLEPLRGVPFEVICLVGMDDGVFPRQDSQRELNLLQKQPMTGDPSVRDADRMTFLQALMAARRCLYLSYTGRDVQDGTALQPSPVIGELLDFLHRYYFAGRERSAFRDALVTEQPMHPFSPRYFAGGERLFTFVDDWRQAALAQQGERGEPEPFDDGSELPAPAVDGPVALGDLLRFYRHPAEWFFRERMRLTLADDDASLADEEPRALDGLQAHLLRERLLHTAAEAGLEVLDPRPSALERARGRLPPPPLGAEDYAAAATEVNTLLPVYWSWQAEAQDEADLDIDLQLDDGSRLLGRVRAVGGTELRRLRPGPLRLKHLLPWWLEYLAVAASGHAVTLRAAGTGDEQAAHLCGQIAPEAARGYLQSALAFFRLGQARPLPYEAYLAERYLRAWGEVRRETGEPKTPAEALDDVNGWLNNTRQPPHPMRDPYLQPLFGPLPAPLGADPSRSPFVAITDAVAGPLWAHMAAPEPAP